MPLSFYIDNELINGFKLTIMMCKDYTLVKSLYLKTQKKPPNSLILEASHFSNTI